MSATLDSALKELGKLDRSPPPIFFDLLHRGRSTQNVGMLQEVCDSFGVPVMHWFEPAAPTRKRKADDPRARRGKTPRIDDSDTDALCASDDDKYRPLEEEVEEEEEADAAKEEAEKEKAEEEVEVIEGGEPNTEQRIRVGNVYQVETVEERYGEDVNTETGFFMVIEVDPDNIAHKGRWLYTHSQVPFVLSDKLCTQIDACLKNDMWAVFVSDHIQRLGNSDDWINVSSKVRRTVYDPVKNGVCVLGVMDGETITDLSFNEFVVGMLLSQFSRGTRALKNAITSEDHVTFKTRKPPLSKERCAACRRIQPISHEITFGDDDRTFCVGRNCHERVRVACNLHRETWVGMTQLLDALAV